MVSEVENFHAGQLATVLCGTCRFGFLKVMGPGIVCEVSRGEKIGEPQTTIVYWGHIGIVENKVEINNNTEKLLVGAGANSSWQKLRWISRRVITMIITTAA